MDAADRYQKDFDLLMLEVKTKQAMGESNLRDFIWKRLERSFTALADARGWTTEQREAQKEQFVQTVLSALSPND
jgi:hypothetical protein